MKPLKNNILIKKDKLPEKIGNIYTPQSLKEDKLISESIAPPYTGTIVYVGPDVTDDDLKPGVRIGFSNMSGEKITNESDEYDLLITDKHVTAVFL